jgi:hypothetical protein
MFFISYARLVLVFPVESKIKIDSVMNARDINDRMNKTSSRLNILPRCKASAEV